MVLDRIWHRRTSWMQPLACRLQLCVIYMYHVCEIVHCRTVNTVILMQNANAEFEEQRGIAINTIKDINGNEQTENRRLYAAGEEVFMTLTALAGLELAIAVIVAPELVVSRATGTGTAGGLRRLGPGAGGAGRLCCFELECDCGGSLRLRDAVSWRRLLAEGKKSIPALGKESEREGVGRDSELDKWWRSEEEELESCSFRFAIVGPGKLIALSLLPLFSPSNLSFPLSLFLGGLGGFAIALRFSTLLLDFIDLFFDNGGKDRLLRNRAFGVFDPDPDAILSRPEPGTTLVPT